MPKCSCERVRRSFALTSPSEPPSQFAAPARQGGGARETRQGSAFAILLHPCGGTGPARFTRPVAFVLSRMQVYRTSRSDNLPYSDPVQSSHVATQLAGPDRTLGPPCIPGAVCRRVRPLLDSAVCIPNGQNHTERRSDLQKFRSSSKPPVSERGHLTRGVKLLDRFSANRLFSTRLRGNLLDRHHPQCCARATAFGDARSQFPTGDTHALGRSCGTHASAVCACVSPEYTSS